MPNNKNSKKRATKHVKKTKKQDGSGFYFGTPMIIKEPTVYGYDNKCSPIHPHAAIQPDEMIGGEGYYLAPPMIGKDPEVHSYRPKPFTIPPTTGGASNKHRNKTQNSVFQQLYNKLKVLGKEQLATLTILLTMKETKKKDMPQRGGVALIQTLLPFSKEMLIVLATLLFLQYYTRRNRKQLGGDDFTKRIISVIEAKNSKTAEKATKKASKMIGGGFMLMDIQNIIAPLGGEAFIAAALLVALQALLQTGTKKQIGGVRQGVAKALKPLRVEKFLASEGLLEMAKEIRRQQKGGLGNEQSEYGCQEEWGSNIKGCI